MRHLPVRERGKKIGCEGENISGTAELYCPKVVRQGEAVVVENRQKFENFLAQMLRPYSPYSFIFALQIILYVTFPVLAQEAPFQLRLEAEKQVLVKNQQGEEQLSWQGLPANATVQPGDVIRYVLRSANSSDRPVKNFVLTQPIPKQTVYVLDSAAGSSAKITYSIDSGKTFTQNPTIEVRRPDGTVERKPAPASSYTHIRWAFEGAIAPSAVQATYQVKVR